MTLFSAATFPSPTRVALLAALLLSCGGSTRVRPNVPAREVTIVNPNGAPMFAQVSAGVEPGPEITVPPQGCAVLPPPHGHSGEMRVQVYDPDHVLALDLYGERLVNAWHSCSCSEGHFSRCIDAPHYVAPPPPPPAPPTHDAGSPRRR